MDIWDSIAVMVLADVWTCCSNMQMAECAVEAKVKGATKLYQTGACQLPLKVLIYGQIKREKLMA